MIDFKTSITPDKVPTPPPVVEGSGARRFLGGNVFVFVSAIIFLLSLVVLGGLFVYKALLEQNIATMSQSIDRVQEAIEPELIDSLDGAATRIQTAQFLLDNHTIVSPILKLLEETTLASVWFDTFNYRIADDGTVQLLLSGEARSYSALALQSDVFGDTRFMEEPIFENLNLNARGNVSFDFLTPIRAPFVLYKNNLETISRPAGQDEVAADENAEESVESDEADEATQ